MGFSKKWRTEKIVNLQEILYSPIWSCIIYIKKKSNLKLRLMSGLGLGSLDYHAVWISDSEEQLK